MLITAHDDAVTLTATATEPDLGTCQSQLTVTLPSLPLPPHTGRPRAAGLQPLPRQPGAVLGVLTSGAMN